MSDDNMKLWDSVSSTDPAYTKPVTLGRKFTAIDPQYQIMKATQALGPIGGRWGWHANHDMILINGIEHAVADVTVWVRHDGQPNASTYGPMRAMNRMYTSTKSADRKTWKIDEDAFKKVTTDALTKLLSHMGISADVFLGKFDGERYTAKQREDGQPQSGANYMQGAADTPSMDDW